MKARFQLFTHAGDAYGVDVYIPLPRDAEFSVDDQDYEGLQAALQVRMPRIVETRANLAALNDAALRMLLELSYRQRTPWLKTESTRHFPATATTASSAATSPL